MFILGFIGNIPMVLLFWKNNPFKKKFLLGGLANPVQHSRKRETAPAKVSSYIYNEDRKIITICYLTAVYYFIVIAG